MSLITSTTLSPSNLHEYITDIPHVYSVQLFDSSNRRMYSCSITSNQMPDIFIDSREFMDGSYINLKLYLPQFTLVFHTLNILLTLIE